LPLRLKAGVNKPTDQHPVVFSVSTLLSGHQEGCNNEKVLAWLSVWSVLQMICILSSWCHCHYPLPQ